MKTKGFQIEALYPGMIVLMAVLPFIRGIGNAFLAEDYVLLKIFINDFGYVWNYAINASRMRVVYFPIGWLVFRGLDENIYWLHLLSILGHILNCLLFYVFASQLFEKKELGFTAALIFSVYPRNHQPVLWIASYHVLLQTFFSLLALTFLLQYLKRQKNLCMVLSIFSAFLAMMTYEIGVVLVVLMLFLEIVYKSLRIKDVLQFNFIKKHIPILFLVLFYAWITFSGNRLYKLIPEFASRPIMMEEMKVEAYQFIGINLDTLRELLVSLTYGFVPQIPLRSLSIDAVTGTLTVVLYPLIIISFLKGGRLIKFAILWFVLSILLIVLFVPFGVADRYFYFSSLAFSILIAAMGWKVRNKIGGRERNLTKNLFSVVLCVYLILSVALIQERINEWRIAGQKVEKIVHYVVERYPEPDIGSEFVIVGVPEYYQQAYFGNFIDDAVQYSYQKKGVYVDTYSTRDPDVEAILRGATDLLVTSSDTYLFFYDQGDILDKTNHVSEEDLESILEFVYQYN